MIKRIKRMINALNFALIHQRSTSAPDMTNICTQIKHFVCDICDMLIEKFVQCESLLASKDRESGILHDEKEQKEHQKVLRLLKTLYGMADEMDTTDFFLQNKENTNIVFVRDDVSGLTGMQEDDTDCAIRFKLLQ